MIKIFFLTLSCLILIGCTTPDNKSVTKQDNEVQDTIKQKKKTPEKAKPTSKYTKEELAPFFTEQESESQILVQPKGITSATNGIYCYFLIRNNRATGLRLHIQYWSENYANVHFYSYDVDGKNYSYIANRSKTGSSDPRFAATTFYWYDNDANRSDINFLNALVKGKNVTVKLIEKSTNEIVNTLTLSEEEKLGIQRTLDYYYALNGALIPKKGMVNIRR